MFTIHDLLEDPQYKGFFCKVPKLPVTRPEAQPWRLFLLLEGNKQWAKKDFHTYIEAFKYLKRKLKQGVVVDATINCRRASFQPPSHWVKLKGQYMTNSRGERSQKMKLITWEPTIPFLDELKDIRWCCWCRRPTEFKYYSKHHALSHATGITIDPSVKRCNICGASTRINELKKAK